MPYKNSWGWDRTQSILPLIFDDSISYYETVSRLFFTVNKLIALINNSVDESLKKYIDERFDNLMINAVYDEENETIFFKKGTLENMSDISTTYK